MQNGATSFNFGRAFSGWWWLLGRDARQLVGISVLWAVASFALMSFDYSIGLTQGLGLLSVSFVVEPLFCAAVCVWALNDHPTGMGSAFGTASGRYLALLVAYLISMIGTAIGLVLLILPGLALAVLWSVWLPVLLAEQKGPVDALRTSFIYVKQHFWSVCGLFVIYASGLMALIALMATLNLGSETGAPGWGLVFNAVAGVPISIIGIYLNVAIYRELIAADGPDLTAFD